MKHGDYEAAKDELKELEDKHETELTKQDRERIIELSQAITLYNLKGVSQ